MRGLVITIFRASVANLKMITVRSFQIIIFIPAGYKPPAYTMSPSKEEKFYTIPARFRRMENMHIAFWLMKDISWCMIWKVLGIAMIIPTLSIAIAIAWRTRDIKSELAHNLAVAFWISA